MHILFAAPGYKPAYRIGGPIISVSALAEALSARGHNVTVFTTDSNFDRDLDVPTDRPVDVHGVEVWYFRRKQPLKKWLPFVSYFSKSLGYLYAPKMRAALDRIVPEVDVVHTHLPFIYPTHAAARAAFKYQKPLFFHQRGVYDPARLTFRSLKKRVFLNVVEKPILRKATALIALTEFEECSYRLLGVHTPCKVIPNGIATGECWQELPAQWSKPLGIDPTAIVILFMGRLHPIKGADRLLRAFLEIQHDCPDAVLVMAGPDEFAIEQRLKEQTNNGCIRGRVLFPGMVSGDLKKALLARADLFCLLSDGEGFSMAILEALASRTPVLISPGCHFPEVEQAGAGRICSLEHESIVANLGQLLGKGAELKRMGENGLDLVRRRYTWDSVADELITLYKAATA